MRDLLYRLMDQLAVWRLKRHYRRHPEDLNADSHLFTGGMAGYEE